MSQLILINNFLEIKESRRKRQKMYSIMIKANTDPGDAAQVRQVDQGWSSRSLEFYQYRIVENQLAEPHSSIGSVADLTTEGPWFGQYSFRGLMIIIATGFIPL